MRDFPRISDVIPMSMQDFEIMRCTTCGAVVPGIWQITRKTMAAGIDHLLEEHLTELTTGRLPSPMFVNCPIQDPFWFDEHAGADR